MLSHHRITLYLCIWGPGTLAVFHLKCASETAGVTALRFETVLLNDEMSPELLHLFLLAYILVLCSAQSLFCPLSCPDEKQLHNVTLYHRTHDHGCWGVGNTHIALSYHEKREIFCVTLLSGKLLLHVTLHTLVTLKKIIAGDNTASLASFLPVLVLSKNIF